MRVTEGEIKLHDGPFVELKEHILGWYVLECDNLALALSDQWRVICPDTLVSGLSQWAENREQDDNFANYCTSAVDLLD